MKKISLLTVLLASVTSFGIAQESTDNRNQLQLALKGGVNHSNVYDEQGDEFNADAKFGLAAGAALKIPFNKYLGIQPEVMLSQKGFQANGKMLGTTYNFTRTTTYLDVPLLFAFKPSEFFTILGGPQYSYLLRQRDVFSNSTNSYEQEQEFDNDNIRKNIFGVAAGLDINMKHVTLGARFCWDAQNNKGDGTSSSPRYKNVWF
jgi:outer membrane protein with beta-barrel domain